MKNVTHFIDESYATVFGDMRVDSLNDDLPAFRQKGRSVGVIFHGSDIRSPARHMDVNPHSYFRLLTPEAVERAEVTTARTRRLARESGAPLFVSTPDLLQDLPDALWLPLVVDLSAWRTSRPALSAHRLRVLHIPSGRKPPIKGTTTIDPAMEALASEGLIDYVSGENVPHAAMPDLVKSVDVVIEQVLADFYGVAAVEAMAAGRLVIGNVTAEVRAEIGRDLPIVDCAPPDLGQLVRDIAADPERFAKIAREGPSYAEQVHSGAKSAKVLSGWLNRDAR